MVIAKVVVSGTAIRTVWSHKITKGMVGAKVEIEYAGETWEKLNRTAVFQGAVTKDVLNVGSEVTIPCEVVAESGLNLFMGIYGTDADNKVAIPTLWIPLGMVQSGADPSGDESTNPALPVWAQMEHRFETLMHLADNPTEMTAAADWAATELNPGHILNRTHWVETVESDNSFHGDMTGRTTLQVDDGMYLVKMSDEVYTVNDLIGHTLTLYMRGEDPETMTYELNEDNAQDLRSEGVPVVMACEGLWSLQNDFSFQGYDFKAGTYFLCLTDDMGPRAYAVESSCLPSHQEIIHKLDSKFIDADWLAGTHTGVEIILPETTQTFSGRQAKQSFVFEIEPGKQYTITWNGTPYICHAVGLPDSFITIVYVGNGHLVTENLPESAEPFCVYSVFLGIQFLGTSIVAAEAADSVTVGVSQTGKVRNRIPYEYLPRVYVMPTDIGYNKVQLSELAEAFRVFSQGGRVFARYNNSTYQVLQCHRDHIDNMSDMLCMTNGSSFLMWHIYRGWTGYATDHFIITTNPFYSNDGSSADYKKYKFTVDKTGALIATDVTGQL